MKKFYIAKGQEKMGPFSIEEMAHQVYYANSMVWKDGWDDWQKASDVPELVPYINNAPPPIKKPKEEKEKDAQSIVDKAYTKIAIAIDKHLKKNSHKIGMSPFYTYLSQVRDFYKSLSEKKQRGLSFFISTALIFVIASLAMWSFSMGYNITKFWIAFIALNQIKAIESVIKTITHLVIFFTLVFLPEGLKDIISRFAKNISILILVYFFGWIVAPIYIIYRIVLIFIDSDEGQIVVAENGIISKNETDEN